MKSYFLFLLITLYGITVLKSQNVGINGTGATAHPSALLDIDAVGTPSLGILIPRIALQALNVSTPVSGPATSLLLYNTASAGTGTNAVTPGYYYWDGVQWVRFNTGVSSGGSGWLLTGNAGTTAGTNFLGTTDNQNLVFKRANIQSGLISVSNTSFGNSALNPLTTGVGLCAFGSNALSSVTTGNSNIAIGSNALNGITTGIGNVSLGSNMSSVTTGSLNIGIGGGCNPTGSSNSFNIGIGSNAVNSNGNYNIAMGLSAIQSSNGDYNIAMGVSCNQMSAGSNNISIGLSTFQNSAGDYNVAIGAGAMGNSPGSNNVAIGRSASGNSPGDFNTMIGANTSVNTGSNNTVVGASAIINGFSCTNSSAIGSNATNFSSNKIRFGNTTITVIEGQVAYSFPSDLRFKNSINENVQGLDFINKLRPVTYKFDTKKFDEFLTQNLPDSIKVKRNLNINFSESQNIIHTGFIAQEVEQAANELGFLFDGVHVPKDKNDNYSVAYSQFVVPLVKAVQELSQKVDELKKINEKQQKEIDLLKKQ